jgi:hypothetical protein
VSAPRTEFPSVSELMDRPAKPAYSKVKVRALKLLKDMAK